MIFNCKAMKELTDELKIINVSINFANENGFEYDILRFPTISGHKKIEMHFGEGIQHQRQKDLFGASFAIKENGNLKYPQIHVYSLYKNHGAKTEEFRVYLEKHFPNIECKW